MGISALKHEGEDEKATLGTTLGLAEAAAAPEPAGSQHAKSNRALLSLHRHSHTLRQPLPVWVAPPAITYTSASRGRNLEALGTQAGEASLGVGAGSKGADLRQLGALVNI